MILRNWVIAFNGAGGKTTGKYFVIAPFKISS